MISRDRRKELLVEILSESNTVGNNIYLPNRDFLKNRIVTNLNEEFIFQDKFSVLLKYDDVTIEPTRIKGFRIENLNGHNFIKVKTYFHVSDWINEFKKIQIIKIFFFNAMNEVISNNLDYDVIFKSFYLDCDYQFRDYMTPVYEYEIFECPYKK